MFALPGKTVALLKIILFPLVGNKFLILGKMVFTERVCVSTSNIYLSVIEKSVSTVKIVYVH